MSPLNMFIELLETLPIVFSLYVCTVVFSVPLGILGALAYTGKDKIVFFQCIHGYSGELP